jgi:hypothetical protein
LAVISFGIGGLWATTDAKGGDVKGGFAMQCDKNDYRGVLAGLEGVTGKKAVNSDAMTVKNEGLVSSCLGICWRECN